MRSRRPIEESCARSEGTVSVPAEHFAADADAVSAASTGREARRVIILPGGGYRGVSIVKEGTDVARAFNEMGIAAFVLKYRTPSPQHMQDRTLGPLQDAQQAMSSGAQSRRRMGHRSRARRPDGLLGRRTSGCDCGHALRQAGAAAMAGRESAAGFSDADLSRHQFRSGSGATRARARCCSAMRRPRQRSRSTRMNSQVTARHAATSSCTRLTTPPCPWVTASASSKRLQSHKVPAELIVYPAGGHGFGLNNATTTDRWIDRCRQWLMSQGWLSAEQSSIAVIAALTLNRLSRRDVLRHAQPAPAVALAARLAVCRHAAAARTSLRRRAAARSAARRSGRAMSSKAFPTAPTHRRVDSGLLCRRSHGKVCAMRSTYGPACPQSGDARANERRLPGAECLDARPARWGQAAGDGVFPRRRIQHGFGFEPALRRRAAVPARRCGRDHRQSSTQCLRASVSRATRRQPTTTSSGNVGLLDLVQALAWVRDHAAEFGGDPRLRDGVRPIRWRREDRDADGDAGGARTVSSRSNDERPADHGGRAAQCDVACARLSRCIEDCTD